MVRSQIRGFITFWGLTLVSASGEWPLVGCGCCGDKLNSTSIYPQFELFLCPTADLHTRGVLFLFTNFPVKFLLEKLGGRLAQALRGWKRDTSTIVGEQFRKTRLTSV